MRSSRVHGKSRRFRKMPVKSRHFSFMAYYTYILKSKIKDRFYVGSCADLTKRLEHHNLGHSRSTKAYVPWEIIYSEKEVSAFFIYGLLYIHIKK